MHTEHPPPAQSRPRSPQRRVARGTLHAEWHVVCTPPVPVAQPTDRFGLRQSVALWSLEHVRRRLRPLACLMIRNTVDRSDGAFRIERPIWPDTSSAICSTSGAVQSAATAAGRKWAHAKGNTKHEWPWRPLVKTRAEKSDLKSTLGLRGRKSGFARSWRHSTCKTPQRRGGRALHTHTGKHSCARGAAGGMQQTLAVMCSGPSDARRRQPQPTDKVK